MQIHRRLQTHLPPLFQSGHTYNESTDPALDFCVDDTPEELTILLRGWSAGDPKAADRLFECVYQQLKAVAQNQLASERAGHTFQPTALVHETYLKLLGGSPIDWTDRVHFFAVAARVIRQILVDYGRGRNSQRRGGRKAVTLQSEFHGGKGDAVDLLALDEALNRLAQLNAGQARIVELRYFGGMTIAETAAAIGQSEATVNRQWRAARAWMFRAMGGK